MKFNQAISMVLCLTHLSLGLASAGAFAAETSAQTNSGKTAEFTLLENVIALQGQNLSDKDLQAQLGTVLTQYDAIAQKDGRAGRLGQAMVALGVYTPAQAQQFMTDVQSAASSSVDFQTVLGQALAKAPEGAQFSWCALGGGVLAGVSALVVFVGLIAEGFSVDSGGTSRPEAIMIGGAVSFAGGIALIVVGAKGDC